MTFNGHNDKLSIAQGEFVSGRCRTWYRVTSHATLNKATTKPPLVVLHGGPGAGHDYLTNYAELASDGRSVIHYDQVGCARSSHFPKAGTEFFNIPLFVKQLGELLSHLKIDNYHLLGHSWGGMLAIEQALTRDKRLKSLVLASTPPSISAWMEAAERLWALQSDEDQIAVDAAYSSGNFQTPEFLQAVANYYTRHVGNFKVKPHGLANSDTELENDGHTYELMWGHYEFLVTGSLAKWDRTIELESIRIPTLVLVGQYDQIDGEVVENFKRYLTNGVYVTVPDSSHVPHLENPQETLTAVSSFLSLND